MDALLSGRDVLGVMPTGAGKSICYQLPALLLPGLTLVISPLISLMKDQVAALIQAGIPAAYINSSLTVWECGEVLRQAKQKAYKLLYVTPERLMTREFSCLAKHINISIIAVDEAHCVSQWGQDFRPSYLKIGEFIRLLPNRPVVGAFTATATAQVKEDIERLLLLEDPLQVTTGFDRPNLFFEVARPKSKDAWLLDFLASRLEQSGIIYCATRKAVEFVCYTLCGQGISATRYHAGLEDQERQKNQEDFVYDRVKVMVATNAFGMGIDKSNVSFVVHYNMPKNMENYYQEAGRAGRDGGRAHCALLFSLGDVQTARFLINNATDNDVLSDDQRELVRREDLHRLECMIAYCKTQSCLRTHMLAYFGEIPPAKCGNCSNCTSEQEQRDITIEAQKILSGVARVERKYHKGLGMTMIIGMLRGSTNARVLELGLNKLSTYGIMKEQKQAKVREYIEFLVEEGYLALLGEYPVLRLQAKSKGVLLGQEQVIFSYRKPAKAEKLVQVKGSDGVLGESEQDLFNTLRMLRTRLASAEDVPAYIVFSNATLADMAEKQPDSMETFQLVSGVGRVKAEKFGQAFLEEIASWRQKRQDIL